MLPRMLTIVFVLGALSFALFHLLRAEKLPLDFVGLSIPAQAPQTVSESIRNAGSRGAGPNGVPVESRSDPPNVSALPVTSALQIWEGRGVAPPPGLREVDSAFAAEAIDRFWAINQEAKILGEIARTEGLHLITFQVECRTTVCRLQLTHGISREQENELFQTRVPDRKYMELFARLGFVVSPRHPIRASFDGRGSRTWLLYIGRDDVARSSATPEL